ncbi:MAG: cell envelope protein SmpA [Rhizobiales bacterium 32-66-11]|nr:MAG: cell envelope protein SmpA [Rhizobiales bacterium 32-66-11]
MSMGRSALEASWQGQWHLQGHRSGIRRHVPHGLKSRESAWRHRKYVLSDGALDQVPVGSSQEQVLLVLGTPSTVSTVNGDVFYYISQVEKRVAFLKPEITEQKVLAIYFDKNRRVTRIANYGLQDGKVFDFVSQKTPTSGEELSVIKQLLSATNFSL